MVEERELPEFLSLTEIANIAMKSRTQCEYVISSRGIHHARVIGNARVWTRDDAFHVLEELRRIEESRRHGSEE